MSLSERVVAHTLATYASLPRHGKPTTRDNGVREWTMLASISLTREESEEITLVSLGTGVKVLPAARLPPLGDALHDCHAEILARRGFVRWLVDEARRTLAASRASEDNTASGAGILQYDTSAKTFSLAPDVSVWLYVSALPCGDASTLHTTAHQDSAIAEAFARAPEHTVSPEGAVRGRKGYENMGAIRTKPGRADSVPSISFSCSDKIATWTAVGLQGGLLGCFAPVYIDNVVVGGVITPEGWEREAWEGEVRGEVERALCGRLHGLDIPAPFRLTRPAVRITPTPFPLSKPEVEADGTEAATSNVSLSYVPSLGKPEVITNGTLGNAWKAPGSRVVKDKQRSRVCKLEIMRAYTDLLADMCQEVRQDTTYVELKRRNERYRAAKDAVRGKARTRLSEAWQKLLPHEFPVTAAEESEEGEKGAPPFTGWITCGERYESFTCSGTLVE